MGSYPPDLTFQTRTRNATGADATAVVRAIRARGTDVVADEVTNQPVGSVEGRGEQAVTHPADALESEVDEREDAEHANDAPSSSYDQGTVTA